MSIFVDDSDLFTIEVHYTEAGENIVILDKPSEKTTTIKMTFKRPNFAVAQRLVASSTMTDPNGGQFVNLVSLQNNMMYFLAQSWDVKDLDGKVIELNADSIGNLRVEIARGIIGKLVPSVGQIM